MCEGCHKAIHLAEIDLKLKGKRSGTLRYAAQMSVIRSMLLKKYPEAIETFGYVTKANRENMEIGKEHYLDACVIASGGLEFEPSEVLYKKRCVPTQSRILTKGIRSEKKIPTGKVPGFRRYDKVEYLGKVCFVKARGVNGIFVLMDIDNTTLGFRNVGGKKEPSYRLIKRINARKGILCIRKRIERNSCIHPYVELKT